MDAGELGGFCISGILLKSGEKKNELNNTTNNTGKNRPAQKYSGSLGHKYVNKGWLAHALSHAHVRAGTQTHVKKFIKTN